MGEKTPPIFYFPAVINSPIYNHKRKGIIKMKCYGNTLQIYTGRGKTFKAKEIQIPVKGITISQAKKIAQKIYKVALKLEKGIK